MITVINLSRRRFIGICSSLGTGLVLGLRLPAKGENASPGNSLFQPNAFVRIDRRGKVTLIFAQSEMGQGIHTALPMLIAEELEVDWAAIAVERDGLNRAYGEQITGGSSSVITAWEPLRKAGATAREMLISAAAKKWKVTPNECRAESGSVIHLPTRRKLGYAALVEAAALLRRRSTFR
ncbi:MAG TPA: molybdopterin cofactor-binding domain-containing protein [Myxococcaceae bacterium]|nr:molybdopterin cofactor-binding domain-containing protein [Myxococcaceae bacterium]